MKHNKVFLTCLLVLSGCSTLSKKNNMYSSSSDDEYSAQASDPIHRRPDFLAKSVIISFPKVANFNQLSIEDATDIIYDWLLPVCEEKKIMLSRYGIGNYSDNDYRVEQYEKDKSTEILFNIKSVQKVFALIPTIVTTNSGYGYETHAAQIYAALKKNLSEQECCSLNYTNVIVAMLLQGYTARFSIQDKNVCMSCNCTFPVSVIESSPFHPYFLSCNVV